jgi:hypothetical protein
VKKRASLVFYFLIILAATSSLFCDKDVTNPVVPPAEDFVAEYSSSDNRLLVGTCYYPWYTAGRHWDGSYMRVKLKSPQPPLLNEYDCAQDRIIKYHVNWSVDARIDFWIESWWGPGRNEDNVILNHQLNNTQFKSKLGYCLLYETSGRLGGIPVDVTPDNVQNFLSDIEYLIDNHFHQKNYLKIDNQPVLYLYLTRTFKGDFAQLFTAADSLLKQHGYDGLYIVGDEVYWQRPNSTRAPYMDAITCYNPHTSVEWVTDADRFVERTGSEMYGPWMDKANELGKSFWVDVLPGFNDLGVRIEAEHPVIERQNGEIFEKMLLMAGDVLAKQEIPLKVLVITSFNEWHEDTQIEPTIETSELVFEPTDYTNGFGYIGYGMTYLDAVKKFVENYTY